MEGIFPDLNRHILKDLKYPENVNLCKTNKKWANICRDDNIWGMYLKRDFPEYRKKSKDTFKQEYIRLWSIIEDEVEYLSELSYIVPKYLNIDAMKNDIRKILILFNNETWESMKYSNEDVSNLEYSLIDVLVPLKEAHLGFDKGELDYHTLHQYQQVRFHLN